MAIAIQILLVLLILASFVVAFYSARTWHWGYVLVVLGIFLSTLGFFVLAAETLRIYAVLGREINQRERELADVQARNEALLQGTEDPNIINRLRATEVRIDEDAESVRRLADLDHQLHVATMLRGRVWRNAAPTRVDPQAGEVHVAVKVPAPAGIPTDSVVYLFEQGAAELPAEDGTPRGAQFLGEFRVAEADAQTARLLPVLPLDDFEWARLRASRLPWAIYATMPGDRHEIFAGMTEEELRRKLPPESVEEYIRHGQPATPDDDIFRQAGFDATGKRLPPEQIDQAATRLYQRRLRDYAVEFDELSRQRAVMEADIAALTADIERLAGALASAKQLHAFRTEDIQKLNTDLSGLQTERQAVARHLAQVRQQLATIRELLAETMRRSQQLAAELAERQGAARRVDGPLAVN